MDANCKNEVIELFNQAIAIKNNNDLITFCHKARYSSERILQIIYESEIGKLPPKIQFSTMLQSIEKLNVIPLEIRKLFETVSATGNPNSHPNNLPESKRKQQASIAEQSLSHICNWFFNDYNDLDEPDLFVLHKNNILDSKNQNYRDLICASLDDGILELDEFEKIVAAKEAMQIDSSKAMEIEREVALKLQNKTINGLHELLNPSDLNSFKKYDVNNQPKPDWVVKGLENLQNDTSHNVLVQYIKNFFEEIIVNNNIDFPILYNLLGSWQGWYFQYSTKTYFNLFFIAKGENEFIGFCIEPINPDWGVEHVHYEPHLYAFVEGSISDEVIFQFQKTMLVENSWEIYYEGVIIDDGQYFEGEWSIKHQNGAFNAMKTKSLLPIRVFDIDLFKPIVPTQFLNNFRNLTSSWFVQMQGKTSQFGIMHILDVKENRYESLGPDDLNFLNNGEVVKVYSNLITQSEDQIRNDYFEGSYVEPNKVCLNAVNSIYGAHIPVQINFSVDWNTKIISGTIKDAIFKIRSFKGYKI